MNKFGIEIKIKKFGPLVNQTVHLSPMTIFSGKSNLGKSYVNYLAYYLFHFLRGKGLERMVETKFKNKQTATITINEVQREMNNGVELFMQNFLRSSSIQCNVEYIISTENLSDLDVSYNIENTMEISNPDDSIAQPRQQPFLIVNINGEQNNSPFGDIPFMRTSIIATAIAAYLSARMLKQAGFPMLLPPSRGAFIGLDYTTTNTITQEGDMYRIFLRDFNTSTSTQQKPAKKYLSIIERITGGRLIVEKDSQYLLMPSGDRLSLTAAASSIREISPFLYSLQSLLYPMRSYCFEEPEAHLHPEMQIAVADLIATSLNDGNIFHITTHSDYILQRINQLIKLDYLRRNSKNEFKMLCKKYALTKDQCINKEKVTVYYFTEGENGVTIQELEVTDNGVPMKTFYNTVQTITQIEDDLNYYTRLAKGELENEN